MCIRDRTDRDRDRDSDRDSQTDRDRRWLDVPVAVAVVPSCMCHVLICALHPASSCLHRRAIRRRQHVDLPERPIQRGGPGWGSVPAHRDARD
eukprot:1768120-Alexandrium_andersonii.AAC.1